MVEENGPGASQFAPGTRVVGVQFDTITGGSGTWQQYMVVSEGCLLAVPDAVSDEAAAQVGGRPGVPGRHGAAALGWAPAVGLASAQPAHSLPC